MADDLLVGFKFLEDMNGDHKARDLGVEAKAELLFNETVDHLGGKPTATHDADPMDTFELNDAFDFGNNVFGFEDLPDF